MSVAGNVYDKYGTRNPVARLLMRGFLGRFDELAARSGVREAHEIGCGEGELCLRLARRGWRVRGSDMSPEIIETARHRGVAAGVAAEFACRSIYETTPARDAAPLIVCCEVLEHVADPQRAVDILASLASPYLLASVPREPLWRALNVARGRYLAALGNTPGHVNHWSRQGFVDLLGRRFTIVAAAAPLPWTMVLARRMD